MSALSVVNKSRFLAALLLSVFLFMLAGQVRAQAADQKPVGPWVVTETKDGANVGLIFYFSPDGTFGMIDPKTLLGVAGTYSIGRTGLLIHTFHYGTSAEFMAGDMVLSGATMTIDVKRSSFMGPQRVVLQNVKVIPPAAPAIAPAPR
jgi:hypothetical protein